MIKRGSDTEGEEVENGGQSRKTQKSRRKLKWQVTDSMAENVTT